jgi:hypothetical protein
LDDIEIARAEPVVRESRFLDFILGPWRYVRTNLFYALLHIRRLLCLVVEEKEVDYAVSEKIENGYPTSWNGTYYWNARFRVRLDQSQQRIDVTIRLRLAGFAPVAQWVNVVQAAWSQRFKDCATIGCATNGYPIYLTLQYVSSGEHYVMNLASGRTVSMLEWGVVDGDQAHEVGHMLGNKEEYFTIDGVDYGPGRQPSGNIMNNPRQSAGGGALLADPEHRRRHARDHLFTCGRIDAATQRSVQLRLELTLHAGRGRAAATSRPRVSSPTRARIRSSWIWSSLARPRLPSTSWMPTVCLSAGFRRRPPGRVEAAVLAPGAQRSVRFRGFMTGAPAGGIARDSATATRLPPGSSSRSARERKIPVPPSPAHHDLEPDHGYRRRPQGRADGHPRRRRGPRERG